MILTAKYRIKDKRAAKRLRALAFAANQVWNFCCETQLKSERLWSSGSATARWPSHFDLTALTAGSSKELGLSSYSIGEICRVFAQSRTQARRAPRFRSSGGPRRSLGWVPFRREAVGLSSNAVVFMKRTYRVFGSRRRALPDEWLGGSFVEDARGRWYLCIQYDAPDVPRTGNGEIGIDLGLKSLVACSDGTKIEAPRIFRAYQDKLSVTKRAGNKKRAQAINAKIANARKDFIHKVTDGLVKENRLIVVGDVSAPKLAKTKMAKSVLDAGWGMLRTQLRYKASRHGATFLVVNEAWTSRTCSACGSVPPSSPKGMGALGIRQWTCSDCGESHDRDTNAALNVLAAGRSSSAQADGSREIAQ